MEVLYNWNIIYSRIPKHAMFDDQMVYMGDVHAMFQYSRVFLFTLILTGGGEGVYNQLESMLQHALSFDRLISLGFTLP